MADLGADGASTGPVGAVLVALPSALGSTAPVQRLAGFGRLHALWDQLLPAPSCRCAEPMALGATDLRTLLGASQTLLKQWRHEPALQLGIDLLADASRPQAAELDAAARIARRAPQGMVALSAEAADRIDRAWELPLIDLGPVDGEAGRRPSVLVLDEARPLHLPDALALRDVLVVAPAQLSGDDRVQAEACATLLSDWIAGRLACSSLLRVVSPESVRRLQDPARLPADAFGTLGASHLLLLRGHLGGSGTLALQMELLARDSPRSLWSERLAVTLDGLLSGEAPSLRRALADLHVALMSESLDLSQGGGWERLEDHQLLIAATQLLHRLSPLAFERAQQMLLTLRQRAPRQARVHAWLAKWHVFAVVQWLEPSASGLPQAQASCSEALRLDPDCALAWALSGFLRLMRGEPLEAARPELERAVQVNPNESLAWIFLALLRTYEDRLDEALEALRMGIALSPLDPWRYFFDSVAAHVHLARGDWASGLAHAEASVRQRARHAPTLIYLAIAHSKLGRPDLAQDYLRQLLELWPHYSVERFWQLYPGRQTRHAREFSWALTAAGLPPHR
jgi:adenylate cyclase